MKGKYGIYTNKMSLKSTLSFFFVRHPFVRIVSAYQNKIIDENIDGGFEKEFKTKPSFSEFVNRIIKKGKFNL